MLLLILNAGPVLFGYQSYGLSQPEDNQHHCCKYATLKTERNEKYHNYLLSCGGFLASNLCQITVPKTCKKIAAWTSFIWTQRYIPTLKHVFLTPLLLVNFRGYAGALDIGVYTEVEQPATGNKPNSKHKRPQGSLIFFLHLASLNWILRRADYIAFFTWWS